MKKSFIVAFVSALVVNAMSASSQSTVSKAAQFELHIQTEKTTYKPGEEILVVVEERNVSRRKINSSMDVDPISWYHMDVSDEIGPAEATDELKNFLHPHATEGPIDLAGSGSVIAYTLKPGQIGREQVPITRYFVMKKPGRYEITFSQETYPGEPDKSVWVKSNTITITVTAADTPPVTPK